LGENLVSYHTVFLPPNQGGGGATTNLRNGAVGPCHGPPGNNPTSVRPGIIFDKPNPRQTRRDSPLEGSEKIKIRIARD
jgi:hypothetical protein